MPNRTVLECYGWVSTASMGGGESIYSNTLCLVMDRAARRVLVNSDTRKNPNVLWLLAQWLRVRRPAQLCRDLPFTRISVSYTYAARRHRDGRSAGPSLTRSLGSFTGGRLKYFPNDDGRLPLEAMRDQDADAFDTRSGFVLFDGNRAHEVEPFLGERYSLVFFTNGVYETGPRDVLPPEISYPTPEAIRYFSSYIVGPSGHDGVGRHLTMREMLGLQVKPLVLWMPQLSFDAIPQECLRRISSYTRREKATRLVNKRLYAALC